MITKAVEASFRAEMTKLKEEVEVKVMECEMLEMSIGEVFESVPIAEALKFGADLKKEIIYWGQYDIGVSEITKEYAKNNWEYILKTEGVLENLYYVDKETAGGKTKRYLYDSKENIVYKKPATKLGKYVVHSIEELNDVRGVSTENVVKDVSQMSPTYEGISHYEPDLTGFVLDKTSVIYYERVETTNDGVKEITVGESIPISAKEYINNGKQRTIQRDGKTYEFYNYSTKVWANILVENSGMKSYWVWIPRYSYKIDKTAQTTDIKFIDLNSTPEEGYELHSDFADGKKGIWVSKYEPTETANVEVSNFPYYLPDMTGFNPENTYVEVYNSQTESFEETKLKNIDDIQKFAKENNWFNYNEQVWGNIRVYEPESKTESWWVWIPRYAYNITGTSTSIKFIDLNNKPLDGTALPSNYVIHPAFGDDLKGIWVSKYEPIEK